MIIEWGILLPAIVLLFYPADRILPQFLRLRSYGQLSDPAHTHRHRWWLWQPALWADALRCAVAIWLVDFSLTPIGGNAGAKPVVLLGGLLLIGVLPQMVTWRKAATMFAPLGYVFAALFVLLPFAAALPVAVLGIVGLMALREFSAIFVGGALVTGVFGYLLGGSVATVVIQAGVFVLPVVVSTMFRCKLVLPVQSRSETVPVPAPR
jgi:hypothetical protein